MGVSLLYILLILGGSYETQTKDCSCGDFRLCNVRFLFRRLRGELDPHRPACTGNRDYPDAR
jgi:hypothetical protein